MERKGTSNNSRAQTGGKRQLLLRFAEATLKIWAVGPKVTFKKGCFHERLWNPFLS